MESINGDTERNIKRKHKQHNKEPKMNNQRYKTENGG